MTGWASDFGIFQSNRSYLFIYSMSGVLLASQIQWGWPGRYLCPAISRGWPERLALFDSNTLRQASAGGQLVHPNRRAERPLLGGRLGLAGRYSCGWRLQWGRTDDIAVFDSTGYWYTRP